MAGEWAIDIGKKVLNGASGTIPKAYLYIRDITDLIDYKEADSNKAQYASALNDAMKIITDLRKDIDGKKIKVLETKGLAGRTGQKTANNGYFKVEVQYNPSSIVMMTEAGKTQRTMGGDMGGANGNQIMQVINPVATTMSFQLILDDVNVFDAFGSSGVNLSVGGAAAMIQASKHEGDYSVQPFVDGLLSLLLLSETRQVIFAWDNMVFRGELTSVSARYTMFNKYGNPVRAVCDLRIRQGDEYAGDEVVWGKAFDTAFGDNPLKDETIGEEDQSFLDQFLNLNL